MTTKQQQILAFIKQGQIKGRSPYHREIAEYMGVCQATIQWHIERMIELGYLSRSERKHRGLSVCRPINH